VIVCDDISGEWNDADQVGNSIGWNLAQTDSQVSGQMWYYSYRSGVSCGRVNYNVTGSYNAIARSFSLSSTIIGPARDGCDLPVAPSATTTVTLSGRACGNGFGDTTIAFSSSVATKMTEGAQRPSRVTRTLEDAKAPLDDKQEQANLSLANLGRTGSSPLQISTTWLSILPRFTVQYASYIPVDHIAGPTPCLDSFPYGWKTYKGDANRGTYRTTESLLVMPSVQRHGTLFARSGPPETIRFPVRSAAAPFLTRDPLAILGMTPTPGWMKTISKRTVGFGTTKAKP
jgi:hypothetical protein